MDHLDISPSFEAPLLNNVHIFFIVKGFIILLVGL